METALVIKLIQHIIWKKPYLISFENSLKNFVYEWLQLLFCKKYHETTLKNSSEIPSKVSFTIFQATLLKFLSKFFSLFFWSIFLVIYSIFFWFHSAIYLEAPWVIGLVTFQNFFGNSFDSFLCVLFVFIWKSFL